MLQCDVDEDEMRELERLEGGGGGDAIAARVAPLVVSPGGGGAGEDSDGEEVVAASEGRQTRGKATRTQHGAVPTS